MLPTERGCWRGPRGGRPGPSNENLLLGRAVSSRACCLCVSRPDEPPPRRRPSASRPVLPPAPGGLRSAPPASARGPRRAGPPSSTVHCPECTRRASVSDPRLVASLCKTPAERDRSEQTPTSTHTMKSVECTTVLTRSLPGYFFNILLSNIKIMSFFLKDGIH